MTAGTSMTSYLTRRFALLALTLVLVPSLSFVMFTLLEGDADGIGGVLSELWQYLQATFLRADLGGDAFQGATFRRAQGALEIVGDGFAVDAYLLGGGLLLGVLGGLAGGLLVGLRPRSRGGARDHGDDGARAGFARLLAGLHGARAGRAREPARSCSCPSCPP